MCHVFVAFQIVLPIHIKTCGHMEIIIELMRMKGAWHMQPMTMEWHAYSTKAVGVLLKIITL
jgi:hypothetical protein